MMTKSARPPVAPQSATKSALKSAPKRTPLFNGALECRLFEFKLVAGSMRKQRPVT
jgi:putative N6-adenine-specific DNA methylase